MTAKTESEYCVKIFNRHGAHMGNVQLINDHGKWQFLQDRHYQQDITGEQYLFIEQVERECNL